MSDRWRPEWQHAGWCATRSRSYNDCDCGLGPLLALLDRAAGDSYVGIGRAGEMRMVVPAVPSEPDRSTR